MGSVSLEEKKETGALSVLQHRKIQEKIALCAPGRGLSPDTELPTF